MNIIAHPWRGDIRCEECGTRLWYQAEHVYRRPESNDCAIRCPTCREWITIAPPPPYVRDHAAEIPAGEG